MLRLRTPETFNPHWLARDQRSNRLVLGAELGGKEGFYLLRFDAKGRLYGAITAATAIVAAHVRAPTLEQPIFDKSERGA